MSKEIERLFSPELKRLSKPVQLMVICGASERLRPALLFDRIDFGRETARVAERVLDVLWSSITDVTEIEEIDKCCEEIEPRNMDDDEADWYWERAFISDACAAVTYSAFFARDGDFVNVISALYREVSSYDYIEQNADRSDRLRTLSAKARSLGDAIPTLAERTMSDVTHAEDVLNSFDRVSAVMKFRSRNISFGNWFWS